MMNDDEAKKAMTALMMVMMLATQTHEVCTQCTVQRALCTVQVVLKLYHSIKTS